MKRKNPWIKRLLFPPLWVIVPLVLLSAAALAYIFLGGYETHPLAYGMFALAFYTLTVTVLFCIFTLPKQYTRLRQAVHAHPLGHRFLTEAHFRTHVSLYSSLCINLLYVGIHLVSGWLYHTAWFVILAVYYAILAVMRFLLAGFVRKNGIGTHLMGELRRSILCSGILLTVNLTLSAAILMILYQGKGFSYNGVLIYVMAAYTFYITVTAIINLVKYRRLGSPVMSMAKIISMAAALVSMLSLETAMFAQFGGEMSPRHQRLMIALTGAGVSIIVIVMSVYSICKNHKAIKDLRKKEHYGTK